MCPIVTFGLFMEKKKGFKIPFKSKMISGRQGGGAGGVYVNTLRTLTTPAFAGAGFANKDSTLI